MIVSRSPSVFFSSLLGSVAGVASTVLRVLLGAASSDERAVVVACAGRVACPVVLLLVVFVLAETTLFAAADPWSQGVSKVCKAFTTTIGKGLALVAVVIAGLMFAFGEGGSKSAMAGLIFGAAMVLGAPAFLTFIGSAATC